MKIWFWFIHTCLFFSFISAHFFPFIFSLCFLSHYWLYLSFLSIIFISLSRCGWNSGVDEVLYCIELQAMNQSSHVQCISSCFLFLQKWNMAYDHEMEPSLILDFLVNSSDSLFVRFLRHSGIVHSASAFASSTYSCK